MKEEKKRTKVLIGKSSEFPEGEGKLVKIGAKSYAVFRYKGKLGCIGNSCLHSGGPLSEGRIKDGRVFCAWHNWDWDFQTGKGWGEEGVGGYTIWEEGDEVYVDVARPLASLRVAPMHEKLKIEPQRFSDTRLRILGISTTMMSEDNPRSSTSEYVLEKSFERFSDTKKFETKILKLRDLKFRECEGYYSRDKRACIWPCSLTQALKNDGMLEVYKGLVEWCDVVVVATPIRWNSASSLYYKMQERLNCLQNQITLYDKVLIQNKVAGFIITGGQDGVQAIAGQMMMFFAEIGFTFGQFPFVGWSRGWYNEDMNTNFSDVRKSDVTEEAGNMIGRAITLVESYRAADNRYTSHKHHK